MPGSYGVGLLSIITTFDITKITRLSFWKVNVQQLSDFFLKDDYLTKAGTLKDFVNTLFVEGSLQQIFGVSDQVLDRYYQASLRLLEEERFDEATHAFFFLVFLNPYHHDFWMGLGIAEQSKGNYEDAAFAYLLGAATNIEDPFSYFNAALCYLAIGEKDIAADNVEQALEQCGDKPEYSQLKTEAKQLQQACQSS